MRFLSTGRGGSGREVAPTPEPDPQPSGGSRPARSAVGVAVALVLIAAAFLIPHLSGWEVHNAGPHGISFPPLDAYVILRAAWTSLVVLILALATVWGGARFAASVRWPYLLLGTCAASLVWLIGLAAIDGRSGFVILGDHTEYLPTARAVHDVGAFVAGFIDRIPLSAEHNWPVHVAGHPPGAVLFFTALAKIGLGGDLAAGLAVCVIAATIPAAVLIAVRRFDDASLARQCAPFLVLTPSAIWLAVSADAVFSACAAWAIAAFVAACTARRTASMAMWAVLSGALFGACAMLSYGLGLIGLVALAVTVVTRRWAALAVAVAVILVVIGGFALAGFALWDAFPVLHDRYWAGLAAERPWQYWLWANFAALAISTGPAVWAGLAQLRRGLRIRTPWLAIGAIAAVVLADLTMMSKAETERIWLPFVPWLSVAVVLLPERHRRWALAASAVFTLCLAHLLKTKW